MPTQLKVVMFTDQVRSTPNTANRTKSEIKRVSDEQDKLTAEAIQINKGKIIKDTGDGSFIEFPSCSDAVKCGFNLQRKVKIRNDAQTNDHLKFELHIGIELGDVIVLPSGDLRGNAANIAARVCSICPPGEVYFTEKIMNELQQREFQIAEVENPPLKGIDKEVKIYRLENLLCEVSVSHNPFTWRSGITEAEDFFNRDKEKHTIRTFLQGRQSCQIVGSRRIGKTSLLLQIKHIASELDGNTVVANIDLQNPHCFTLSEWLLCVGQAFGWKTKPNNLVKFGDCIEAMLSKGQHPILCLDEFEEFKLRRNEFTHDFFSTLRSYGQRGMSIITTSQKPLSELTEPGDPSSPFYNTFPIVRLSVFSSEDAKDFVNLKRPSVEPFTSDEKNEILKFANGHPLALNVACFHVLESKGSNGSLIDAMQRTEDDMKGHLPGWRRDH